ncbi:MAG: type II secretion system F family protein [Kineosporiaceae bacterium]|nr:type II secretion system F family protein [Kineosporiaceae bacterium]
MTPILAALGGALLVAGPLLIVAGVRRVPESAPRPARARRARLWGGTGGTGGTGGLGSTVTRRTWWLLGVGVAAGLSVAITTGWVIAVPLLPLAIAGLPLLLAAPSGAPIARLEALEEWARSLAGVLTVGVGLEQALMVTLRAAPRPIHREVSTLVSRLHARWPTEEALRAFADDLDDATGDLIAAKLVLASRRRGPGLAAVLESLAESVAADVRTRRQVEADRDKPRATVRWVTVITLVALVLFAFNTNYIAPYRSPVGQLLLGLLLGLDAGCLVWMRLMTRSPRVPRFIGRGFREGVREGLREGLRDGTATAGASR